MERLVLEFDASEPDGTTHHLFVYQNAVDVGTRRDPGAVGAGLKRIVTDNGGSVERLGKGKYRIVQTGALLSSDSADAP